jgi:hypothetical protein
LRANPVQCPAVRHQEGLRAGPPDECSTRSLKGIILIETGTKKYGITPADEGAFLADLRNHLEAN